jgi:hypothetical protein
MHRLLKTNKTGIGRGFREFVDKNILFFARGNYTLQFSFPGITKSPCSVCGIDYKK